jgi:hypothetical protein
VRDGIGADLLRDLDLPLGDKRARDRGAKEIRALVERIRPEHGKNVVAHELFAQILDEDVLRLDAEKKRLLACRLELLALAEIGGEGHHLAAIGGLQPFQDDGGIEPAGISEHHLLHRARFGVLSGHCQLRSVNDAPSCRTTIASRGVFTNPDRLPRPMSR